MVVGQHLERCQVHLETDESPEVSLLRNLFGKEYASLQSFLTDSPAELLASLMLETGNEPQLLLVSAPSGAGKTRWCQQLVDEARRHDVQIVGLLSPAVFEDGRKTRIDLMDASTGERRPLAARRESCGNGLEVGCWLFDPAILQWGNDLLASLPPCQVLLIDELGPLEFERQLGLVNAFDLLDARRYRLACVALRPTLLPSALQRWDWAQVLPLPGGGDAT
jgi:nucleoside-triphosphatase THEP1